MNKYAKNLFEGIKDTIETKIGELNELRDEIDDLESNFEDVYYKVDDIDEDEKENLGLLPLSVLKLLNSKSWAIMYALKTIARQSPATLYNDQVGCIIVDMTYSDLSRVFVGYNSNNGKPIENIKIGDSVMPYYIQDLPTMLNNIAAIDIEVASGITHAEINAINNIPKHYKSDSFIAIVSKKPCNHCMKALKEAGIKYVIYNDTNTDYIYDVEQDTHNSFNLNKFTTYIPKIEYVYTI